MWRILFNIFAAASLALSVAMAVLWLRSRSVSEEEPVVGVADLSLYVSPSIVTLLSLHLAGVNDREPDRPTTDPQEAANFAAWANQDRESEIKAGRDDLLSDGGLLPGGRFSPAHSSGISFVRDAWPMGSNGRFSCSWSYWRLVLPCWLVVVSTLVLPIIAIALAVRRAARRAPGGCCLCGYDLRATPESCPECGTVQKHGRPAAP